MGLFKCLLNSLDLGKIKGMSELAWTSKIKKIGGLSYEWLCQEAFQCTLQCRHNV